MHIPVITQTLTDCPKNCPCIWNMKKPAAMNKENIGKSITHKLKVGQIYHIGIIIALIKALNNSIAFGWGK